MIVSVLLLTVFRMSCASQSKPQAYWLPPAMGATPAAPPLDPKEGVNVMPPTFSTQAEINQHLQTAFQNGVDQSNVIGTIVKDPITGAISVSMPSTTNNNLRGGLVQTNKNNMRFKSSQSSYLPSAPYTGVASVSPQFYQAGVSFAPGNLASLQSTMPPAPNVQALLNPPK